MNIVRNILVLGSNGKTGSRVADRLLKRKYMVRMGSRKAPIPFDWDDAGTWGAALAGVDAVYIAFQPDLAVPGADLVIAEFAGMAVAAGVKKLVLLSGRGEPEAVNCEEAIMRSGVDWTIVRASWFMQNFSEGYMLEPLQEGFVALPAGEVGEPFIDADDIADVAVAALTDDRHSKQLYEVTGPALLTFREAVTAIGTATGRAVQYHEIPIDHYRAALEDHGVPSEVIGLLSYLFIEVLDGRNASVTDGVERALERAATGFDEFIRKAVRQGYFTSKDVMEAPADPSAASPSTTTM